VAADLRERVARAIARDENGDETGWQAWRNEADAVLAELQPELQPQAEPVGEVGRALQYLDRYLSAGLAAPDWAIHLASILTGGDGAAAPQPQATPEALAGLLPLRAGNLPTMNGDPYPGLGTWWVNVRCGEVGRSGGEVFARVYGDSPDEARARAVALCALLAAR
jgi:hypothetical protein